MIDIYGTLGPRCADPDTLEAMFRLGMTGVRLNLSHTTLAGASAWIEALHTAAARCGVTPKLLIDMQGPELRIGKLAAPLHIGEEKACSSAPAIPVPAILLPALRPGQTVLLDDGKILLTITEEAKKDDRVLAATDSVQSEPFVILTSDGFSCRARVERGGILTGSKSIALPGASIQPPAMTEQDLMNLREANKYGVTGVMQPFVRSADDLRQVREALDAVGCRQIRLFAKIENLSGVEHLESFFPYCDEVVIARGDLGNAMSLWQLPRVQKELSARCRASAVPFMVVTQMLDSMTHRAVPTRAEVSDIYNAVLDGAASVMVTGETAAGDYPVEVIRYLVNTVKEAIR